MRGRGNIGGTFYNIGKAREILEELQHIKLTRQICTWYMDEFSMHDDGRGENSGEKSLLKAVLVNNVEGATLK